MLDVEPDDEPVLWLLLGEATGADTESVEAKEGLEGSGKEVQFNRPHL